MAAISNVELQRMKVVVYDNGVCEIFFAWSNILLQKLRKKVAKRNNKCSFCSISKVTGYVLQAVVLKWKNPFATLNIQQ